MDKTHQSKCIILFYTKTSKLKTLYFFFRSMVEFVLPNSIDFVPDIVVIGTQESCSVRFEWEVSLQETLGPTHILLHSAVLGKL